MFLIDYFIIKYILNNHNFMLIFLILIYVSYLQIFSNLIQIDYQIIIYYEFMINVVFILLILYQLDF